MKLASNCAALSAVDLTAIGGASRLPLLHRPVLAQCDGLDGQQDGLLTDPRACNFDPTTIQCASDEDSKPTQAVESWPVYPYARHTDCGSSDKSGHYKRGAPLINAPTPNWRGADFHSSYTPHEL